MSEERGREGRKDKGFELGVGRGGWMHLGAGLFSSVKLCGLINQSIKID